VHSFQAEVTYSASMDVRNFLQAPLVKPNCCSCSSLRLHNWQAQNTTRLNLPF